MTKKIVNGGTGEPVVVTAKNGRPQIPTPRVSGVSKDWTPHTSGSSQPRKTSVVPGGNLLGDIVAGALNLGSAYLGSEIAGSVSEKYDKRAEERADARYRQLLVDEPGLTFQGRLAAGLNPYGDADIPGMVSQSNPDTSSDVSGDFLPNVIAREQLSISRQQLANDTLLAESQAAKNFAEADATRGGESRNEEKHPYILSQLVGDIENKSLQNSILRVQSMYEEEKTLLSLRERTEVIANLIVQARETVANTALLEQQVNESITREVLYQSEISLNNANLGLVAANIQNLNARTAREIFGLELDAQSLENLKAQARVYESEADLVSKKAKYAGWTAITDGLSNVIGAGSSLVGNIAKFLPAGQVTTVVETLSKEMKPYTQTTQTTTTTGGYRR